MDSTAWKILCFSKFQFCTIPAVSQLHRLTFLSTDFEIACCFDHDLCLQDPDLACEMEIPLPLEYAVRLRNPLLEYPTTFWEDREELELSDEAAQVLDDVRSLATAINSSSTDFILSRTQTTAACKSPLVLKPLIFLVR